ncbi:MAG: hypothetical protein AAF492_29980, partial [Verrucomicrobiota bacterium]
RTDGLWERTQPHAYSGCGLSYIPKNLPAGSFFAFLGHYPVKGERSTVRYRAYGGHEIISNTGVGWVPLETLKKARRDQMALNHVPLALRDAFNERHSMTVLGVNPPARRMAALALIQAYDRGHFFRDQAEAWIEQTLAGSPSPGERRATAGMRDVLNRPWKHVRDRKNLLAELVAGLNEPQTDRLLLWATLQELLYGEAPDAYSGQGFNLAYSGWHERDNSMDEPVRRKLLATCRKVMDEGPDAEQGFAASVYVSTSIGDGLVSREKVADLVAHPADAVWRWAAMALVKAEARDLAIDRVAQRSEKDHLHVIWMLHHRMPERLSEKEEQFWKQCGRAMPGPMAYVYRNSHLHVGREISRDFRPSLIEFLNQESAEP